MKIQGSPKSADERARLFVAKLLSDRKRTAIFVVILTGVLYGSVYSINKYTASLPKGEKPHSNTRGGGDGMLRKRAPHQEKECTVWMAPSSLNGNAGFGIFTTRDMEAGDKVLGGPDGISIPITKYHTSSRNPLHDKRKNWIAVWDNFWWGRGVPDHVAYEAPTDVVDYQINFGALPNHHCVLDSLDIQYPEPAYDDSLVSRFRDPGAGAFSYSMGREFTVTEPAEAGDELFLDYGYCTHDGNPDWTDHIFMTEDFEQAAQIMWKYKNRKDDPDSMMKYDSSGNLVTDDSVTEMVARLLPETEGEFTSLIEGVFSPLALVKVLAKHKSLTKRTPEWIKSNGMCLEHMVPGKSTIQGAGQGAFAQHTIRKGEMIVPAPLLHIMDEDVLALYDDDYKKGIGTQLLENYCFGHNESSLLLCPETNAVLINHCSHRTKECGPEGPNAEYRWSSGWDATSDSWRDKTLEEIAQEKGRGLAFEFVALRNIKPGDEIFIDYGVEWEEAWKEHVANWKPAPMIDSFISAKDANEKKGPILDMLVSGDLRQAVDHPYLFTGCVYHEKDADSHWVYDTEESNWQKLSDSELLETYGGDGSGFHYSSDRGYTKHHDLTHWPCSVLRQEKDGSYTVRIHQSPYEYQQKWDENDLPRILTNYPRESIHYFVKPFSSDQHLPGVFRHPLGIRDEIFPTHWKNLRDKGSRN